MSTTGDDAAVDGEIGDRNRVKLLEAAGTGVGVVLTELTAVTSEGRITPGTPGLYDARHEDAWRRALSSVHAEAPGVKVAVRLGHAGRRGSTRPRREGIDRPLRTGNWRLVAASPIAYTRWGREPGEVDRADMDRIREAFVDAASMADRAGFDLLEVDMGHGYLLAGFLSPLSNRRSDRYGGSLQDRMRFPLEVFDSVRAAWPAARPLAARLTATDWATGGLGPHDAVRIATALKEHGCDLIEVVAGQTVAEDRPEYGRLYLASLSDRIRNEAAVPTLVSGNITTLDEVNTILAAGRADLCILDVPP